MNDDQELQRRANADWLLVAERSMTGSQSSSSGSSSSSGGSNVEPAFGRASSDERSDACTSAPSMLAPSPAGPQPPTSLFKGIYLNLVTSPGDGGHSSPSHAEPSSKGAGTTSVLVGSDPSCTLLVEGEGVAAHHACLVNLGFSRCVCVCLCVKPCCFLVQAGIA